MATELKLRRGTTSQHQTFTGASSEVTVDSDKNTVVVHDGSTAGGHPLLLEKHEPKTSDVHGVPSSEDIVHTGTDIESQVKTATNATGSAPVYACRAWVNFNGEGTVSIRGSGNVSSITDRGTGRYTVNFATDMPDTTYTVAMATLSANTSNFTATNALIEGSGTNGVNPPLTRTESALAVAHATLNDTELDAAEMYVSIFR